MWPLCDCLALPQGLKTGMYYLRTRPAASAIQFTVDQAALSEAQQKKEAAALACSRENREACLMCSS